MEATKPKLDLNQLLSQIRKDIGSDEKKKLDAKAAKGRAAADRERRKKLRIGEFAPKPTRTFEEILAEIEAARQWEPQAIVLHTQVQVCQCGERHQSVVGLFVRSKSRTTGAQKFAPTNGEIAIDLYPREHKEWTIQVPACHWCFKVQSLVDLVFNGVPPEASGQQPLFNSLL